MNSIIEDYLPIHFSIHNMKKYLLITLWCVIFIVLSLVFFFIAIKETYSSRASIFPEENITYIEINGSNNNLISFYGEDEKESNSISNNYLIEDKALKSYTIAYHFTSWSCNNPLNILTIVRKSISENISFEIVSWERIALSELISQTGLWKEKICLILY